MMTSCRLPMCALAAAAVMVALSACSDVPRYELSFVAIDSGAGKDAGPTPMPAEPDPGVDEPEPQPTAFAIHVAEGTQVAPQTDVHLSAAGADGEAPPYSVRWEVKPPPGLTAEFLPSNTAVSPTIRLDGAGTWRIGVTATAWLPTGRALPETKWQEIKVVPTSTLHVQLTWSTPGDPDPTDKGPGKGADVDLHLVPAPDHAAQSLSWFTPLDTFFENRKPDWTSYGVAVHGARLDLDDTDGTGPENINLDSVAGSTPRKFVIGVHAWDPMTYGDSLATVNVWVDGEHAATYGPQLLKAQQMWTVAKFVWPNGGASKTAAVPALQPCDGPSSDGSGASEYCLGTHVWQIEAAKLWGK